MRLPLTSKAAACLIILTLGSLPACGSSSSACAVPVREELDPNHLLHTLNATDAVYKTDPPTSGAHLSAPAPVGLVSDALIPAVQVTILERGDVLVQYRDANDLDALRSLAKDRVVVAPQPSLPARVVATAWTYKLTCSDVDTKAIVAFANAHVGKPQEH